MGDFGDLPPPPAFIAAAVRHLEIFAQSWDVDLRPAGGRGATTASARPQISAHPRNSSFAVLDSAWVAVFGRLLRENLRPREKTVKKVKSSLALSPGPLLVSPHASSWVLLFVMTRVEELPAAKGIRLGFSDHGDQKDCT